ncbi:MAG: ATPase [Coprobacillus sp.]|nr:ATPase [Coprobacillus sp.]
MKKYLGLEFGSTRIKAVIIDERANVLSISTSNWSDHLEDGLYSYSEEEIQKGMVEVLSHLEGLEEIDGMGVSAMMHGYIALDKNDHLLVPFRTWRNTNTQKAADELTSLFGVNIPLRWSIAHLYQAILDNEPHVKDISYITTLAGYVHYKLTGEKTLGVGDASGMFPINPATGYYNQEMLDKFSELIKKKKYPWKIEKILPKISKSGQNAGKINENGVVFSNDLLRKGLGLCPPEGDAQTGMVATHSIKEKSGNVSAGTSAFTMVVLSKPLKELHRDIDIVLTPEGREVAMVHANECTQDLNKFVSLLEGKTTYPEEDIYSYLFHLSEQAYPDIGLTYSQLRNSDYSIDSETAEVTCDDVTLPLADFMKCLIYECVAPLAIGMKTLRDEKVKVKAFVGHGGYFKTPDISGTVMSAALETPIQLFSHSSEGGAWGMALLASSMDYDVTLSDYLDMIFKDVELVEYKARKSEVKTFKRFLA